MRIMEFVGKVSQMGDKMIIIIPKNYHDILKKEKLEKGVVSVKVDKV